jgi:hypothetical protein
MSYQVAAIRLLAASKGDNGAAKKAFRARGDFFEKSLKRPEIRAFTRASLIEVFSGGRQSGRKLPWGGKVIAALTR